MEAGALSIPSTNIALLWKSRAGLSAVGSSQRTCSMMGMNVCMCVCARDQCSLNSPWVQRLVGPLYLGSTQVSPLNETGRCFLFPKSDF
jgi:hypothetical protein